MIELMRDERVFVNHGPIQMTIDVSNGRRRYNKLGQQVAYDVIAQFEEMLGYMDIVKGLDMNCEIKEEYPEVLVKMIKAVKAVGDISFTPLAAVAGSFSEYALEKAISYGAGRIIINNGGDIALKDMEGNSINVGIPLENNLNGKKLVFKVDSSSCIEGICTSGFGGRSFTKGIADKAVALSIKASIADVCATFMANETNIDDENIVRALAEEIDSVTDIKGHVVTLKIGKLTKEKRQKALINGYSVAEKLYADNLIKRGAIILGEDILLIPDNFAQIK